MVVDMPLNSYPAMTTPELLKAKVRPSPVAFCSHIQLAVVINEHRATTTYILAHFRA